MSWIFTSVSPSTFWGLGAALPAVLTEYLYRRLPGPWHEYWWVWTPIGLSISFCLCQLLRQPNSALLDAFVVWAFSTTAMRVVLSVLVLGKTIKGGTWFALGLLAMARIAQSFWGR